MSCNPSTAAEQNAATDRLQLRSFLTPFPVAAELDRCLAARSLAVWHNAEEEIL